MAQPNKRLWRRCQQLAEDLPMPIPFHVKGFVAALARRRGRPIELMPVGAATSAPCGLLMTTDRADYIMYPTNTTELHQRHILLHEIGHLLCGHTGSAEIDVSATKALMPHLSDELVRRVLGRTVYSDVEEQEAELLASLIAQRAAHEQPPPTASPVDEVAIGAARLDTLFGAPHRHRPHRD